MVLITSVIVLVYGLNEEKRMEETARAQHARAIEQGAVLLEAQCSRCHGTQGLGIPGLCPPLNDRYFFDQRLKDVGWSGTQEVIISLPRCPADGGPPPDHMQQFKIELTFDDATKTASLKTLASTLADIEGTYELVPSPDGQKTLYIYKAKQTDKVALPISVDVQRSALKESFVNQIRAIKKQAGLG